MAIEKADSVLRRVNEAEFAAERDLGKIFNVSVETTRPQLGRRIDREERIRASLGDYKRHNFILDDRHLFR